ncbi:MAG: hypothetical protein JWQ96_1918 [Segetibacter sp.]|nr:hypothetical protein [Segetibacter sp.]
MQSEKQKPWWKTSQGIMRRLNLVKNAVIIIAKIKDLFF